MTKMAKGELLYEGKGKRVFTIPGESNSLWLEFKDSLTAFNAQKKGSFENKGAIGRDIASIIFRYLKKDGVNSHWQEDVGSDSMVCEKLNMIPLEVVVRNYVAGSFAKKFALKEGEPLSKPIVEFYLKKDELNDPFLSDDQALLLGAAKDQKELDELKTAALKINNLLIEFFAKMHVKLIDFKLEFGRNMKGELKLGDEITPDSCRLWDLETNKKLDKDRFRQDLGGVAEGYKEVLSRIRNIWGKSV
jgi:phosphoribosylaminoimidazole-succinocarboxamide synthase